MQGEKGPLAANGLARPFLKWNLFGTHTDEGGRKGGKNA